MIALDGWAMAAGYVLVAVILCYLAWPRSGE
jgi:hypothetical protein